MIRADGLAIKSLDAVQSYYPTPFTITSEELRKEVRERREHAYSTANKVLDDRVRTPAYSAAQAIDQVRFSIGSTLIPEAKFAIPSPSLKKFTPIVDIVEDAVIRLHTKNGDQGPQSPTTENKFQYQRAYALSRDLRDQLARYSVDQFKQVESQNVLVYVPSLISNFHRDDINSSQEQGLSHRPQDHRNRFLLLCNRSV